jgi:hypothetical protein
MQSCSASGRRVEQQELLSQKCGHAVATDH